MKKTIPTFKTDKEAEDFVAAADLTDYDLSGGEVVENADSWVHHSQDIILRTQQLNALVERMLFPKS